MQEKTTDSKSNKRHYGRVHFLTDLILTYDGKPHKYDETYDICMEGLFVITDERPPIGKEGVFSFSLSCGSSPEAEINGKFAVANWQERDSKPGIGIKFVELNSDSSLELYKIIRYNTPD